MLADNVDLPSPNKKAKIPATDIDQRIDSHYLGHLNLSVELLNDACPESWLDRTINEAHARNVSDAHRKELEKVWVHIYDNQLTEDEIRRLAAIHNIGNVGSMTTPWMTRVHACREWLYKSASKILTKMKRHHQQAWKIECQSMYVPKNKDPNTLEPTLQAALLQRDVYQEFRRVGELFSKGEVKDQKKARRKTCNEIPQSKLGMPLQGLANETKKEVLKQVIRRELSLKELQQKCQRIKKKQLVVNAFLKHAGETSYDELHTRFPLHATEEKLAQFSSSQITKNFTPQEVIAFFERALEWENNEKPSSTLNLREERDGIYFFVNGQNSGVLINGSMESLPLERLKTLIVPRSFKGFSLVLALIARETTERDLMLLLTSIHAANIDIMQLYNVVLIHDDNKTIAMAEEVLRGRMTQQQCAFWVNTKFQKLQGQMMVNCVKTISISHWSKDNTLSDANCHFKAGESGSNAFCFEEEREGRLPKSLSTHIIKHFSYEGQWVLDLTQSKDSGIVAALSNERNCVSLMNADDLRDTAKAANNSMSQNRVQDGSENENTDRVSDSEDDE
ncbi:hypothetical protein AC249_AIPGENE13527 [Exaiptasia diaphana]|nr:hypothetical protein AC249_AIPGENE13527 [Exaiptasia diaphana]